MVSIRNWYEHFFEGLAADVWRGSVSPEETAQEAGFLIHHLKLTQGNCVLDVPCAEGRLAEALAHKGISVTGLDLSKRALDSASSARWQSTTYVAPKYVQGDMRHMQFNQDFDGAFCMGNSFGYFDRDDTFAFLQGISRALKPGAGFLLETALAAETLFSVGGTHEWVEVDGVFMLMNSNYDPRTSRLDSRFVFISGALSEEHSTQHYIYTAGEICRMCEQAGMQIKHLFGALDGSPFAVGSERLLVHCVKADD